MTADTSQASRLRADILRLANEMQEDAAALKGRGSPRARVLIAAAAEKMREAAYSEGTRNDR
ncbi:MAG: hypothetical protein KGL35_11840 [Bradyrhizobium sp.]|nr:hypothetical protein [Bradyrhizobium sp.]